MVEIKRMMETDEDGVERQFMPITEISAVMGLEKIIAGQSKVYTVNGKTGAVILTRADLGLPTDGVLLSAEEYSKVQQLLADYEEGKLGTSSVTFEKVGGEDEK